MIRVFLVEDHSLVRSLYGMLIDKAADIELVGDSGNGEDALPAIRTAKPDVVVTDLHLPGLSGLELTERLLRGSGGPRVVVVSMQVDGPMPKRLLEAGASAYLSKDCPGEELLRAIREAASGRRHVGADVARHLAMQSIDGAVSPFDQLSPREVDIGTRLARGQRMADMAIELSLSPKTVATHKYRLLTKLGVSDVVALARLARQYGLIET